MNCSLYVHIPFCKHRCHYCDFNTYAGKESLIPKYISVLATELRLVSQYLESTQIHSLYFGGGTPSLISLSEYQRLFNVITADFSLTGDCEISLEANPGTVSLPYLSALRDMGFNRISFGVQSTNPVDLPRLDRIHTVEDTLEAVFLARRAGFDNLSFDLIFNFPWQDLSSWQHSLARAVDFAPEHLSLYSLIIEPGTLFHEWYQQGLIAPQDDDLAADMYESALKLLRDEGYLHYEISNWAKVAQSRDYRCRHNLQYWLNQPYIGVGAGAHGYLGHVRTENVLGIDEYIQCLTESDQAACDFPATPATLRTTEVDRDTQMKDFMWLGLRLVDEGVSAERFEGVFGVPMAVKFQDEIETLLRLGLVRWRGNQKASLKLTHRGILMANQVFMQFVQI